MTTAASPAQGAETTATAAGTGTTSPAATTTGTTGTGSAAASGTETTATATVVAPARVIPETYDLRLPDGYDVEDAKAVAAMAKTEQWTLEEAQGALQASHDWQVRQRTELRTRLHADPEVGGEHLPQAQQHALRVLDRFMPASDPARARLDRKLNKAGDGDDPDVVRLLFRIGKAMGEDGMVMRTATQTSVQPWDKLYPTKTGS